MNEIAPVAPEPLLRTLSPALRGLDRQLRTWLDATHNFPISTLQKAALEGVSADLQRQAEALQLDRPLLIIILMGGTGVGKSTLLNALAGGAIAQASFTRPTTRDPVVYYHESLKPDRFDPALRLCKLVSHGRPALEQKILVDTPDIDSNDLANRDKLMQILPVADIVLYVGSQEKYHDQVGWELFLEQRRRRAFAFVLNKWDRCLHPGATGTRPDEDLLQDLKGQGFQNPLLFRTCAQHWVDNPDGYRNQAPPPVEGEMFRELMNWLELGLTRLEVEAIKARGVGQMLHHFEKALEAVRPPDLTKMAERTQDVWRKTLAEEARAEAVVLLNTLEPYQKEVEHHFAMERQQLFGGPMATYLKMINKLKYWGSTLRDRIPFRPRLGGGRVETQANWDLSAFALSCSKAASEKHIDARNRALANRLVVEGDTQGFPVNLLSEPTETASQLDWSSRNAEAISQVMGQIETVWTKPTGVKRFVQGTVIFLANYLPILTFVAMVVLLVGRYVWPEVFGAADNTGATFSYLLLPPLLVIILLHLFISLVLPLHWKAIRADLEKHLEKQLEIELVRAYCPIPEEVAKGLLEERKEVDRLAGEVREVAGWLEKSEKSSTIHEMYGN